MRRSLLLIALFAMLLAVGPLLPAPAQASTMSWTPSASYTDGTPIPATDQARIVYTPYHGNSSSGPWTADTPTAPGVTSATVPTPSAGQTLWYTVEATLDGQTSAKAQAVSLQVPYKTPAAPTNLRIAP